jgi:NitT/TauT family transport system substrate-binding protein
MAGIAPEAASMRRPPIEILSIEAHELAYQLQRSSDAAMKAPRRRMSGFALVLATACELFFDGAAHAEKIVVSNYGVAATGMPYAVALEMGYFKEFNIDIDGIINAEGAGGIRALIDSKLAYAEVSPLAVLNAVQSGADLRIISGNVHTAADFLWVALPSSPVNSVKDLRGRRLSYTNAGSTSEALDHLWLDVAAIPSTEVTLNRTGGLEAQLTYLDLGGIDVAPIAEPMWSARPGKYKVIASAASVLPALSNVVGVTTSDAARTRRDFIQGVLKARRKAVEYISTNPEASAIIIARAYKLDPAVSERVILSLLDSEKNGDIPYWSRGDFRLDTMNNVLAAQKLATPMIGVVSWSKIIDESFLPYDLTSKTTK